MEIWSGFWLDGGGDMTLNLDFLGCASIVNIKSTTRWSLTLFLPWLTSRTCSLKHPSRLTWEIISPLLLKAVVASNAIAPSHRYPYFPHERTLEIPVLSFILLSRPWIGLENVWCHQLLKLVQCWLCTGQLRPINLSVWQGKKGTVTRIIPITIRTD